MPKRFLFAAYLLLLVGIIAMLSPSTCSILQERNRELDKLSWSGRALASTQAEESFTLAEVQTRIRFAKDTHQLWLNFLVSNPQWLKDHKAEVDAVPTLYSPEWHRYWIKVYGATLHYLKQVP